MEPVLTAARLAAMLALNNAQNRALTISAAANASGPTQWNFAAGQPIPLTVCLRPKVSVWHAAGLRRPSRVTSTSVWLRTGTSSDGAPPQKLPALVSLTVAADGCPALEERLGGHSTPLHEVREELVHRYTPFRQAIVECGLAEDIHGAAVLVETVRMIVRAHQPCRTFDFVDQPG
jgi:hypothetical protein